MDEEYQARPFGRTSKTPRGTGRFEEKPLKTFTKLPANYSELSEQERKKWAAEVAQRILGSLKARDRELGRDPETIE